MLIIKDHYGRLGNRLWQFSYLIAFGYENNIIVSYPGFKEYAHYFEGTKNNYFCSFPALNLPFTPPAFWRELVFKSVPLAKRIFTRLNVNKSIYQHKSFKNREYFDMDDNLNRNIILGTKFFTIEGWLTRCNKSLIKHRKDIKKIFTPSNQYFKKNLIPKDESTLIGIHIRQKDKNDYPNPGYLYLNESSEFPTYKDYVNLMNSCLKLFGECTFIVVSNLPIEKRFFRKNRVFYTNSHLVQDLYTLSSCDYIIGTSSTFTLWASFFGEVPYFMIEKKKKDINRESFNIYKNLA